MRESKMYIGALKLIDRLQEKQEDDINVLRYEVRAISKINKEEIDLLIDKLIKRRLLYLKNTTVCYMPFIVEPIFNKKKEALLSSYIYGCYDIIKKQVRKKKIILLIDTSCSIGETLLKELKPVVRDFLLDLLPYYDISIFTFADRVYHLTDFTSDEKLLISIIDNLHEKRGFIFAQALQDALSYIKQTSRRTRTEVGVILLTDGQIRGRRDVDSQKDALKRTSFEYKQLNITFYVVGIDGVFGVNRENLSLFTDNIYYLEIDKDLESPFLKLLKELKISYSSYQEEGYKDIKKFIKEKVEGMKEGLEKLLQKIIDYSFVVIDTPFFGIFCHYPEASKSYFIPAFIRSTNEFLLDDLNLSAERVKDIIKEELKLQIPATTKTHHKEYPYLHFVSCFNQENIGIILSFLSKQKELSNFHLFYLSYIKRLINYQGVFLTKLRLATIIAKLPSYIKEVLPTYKPPEILRSEATYILEEEELLEKYPNKYLAIRDAQFLRDESGGILVADTYDELLSLVKKRDNLLIKKVEGEKKQINLSHMAY